MIKIANYKDNNKVSVLIVGAGPAGLAVREELRRAGVPNIVIDNNSHIGGQLKAPIAGNTRWCRVKNAGWLVLSSTEKIRFQSRPETKYSGPKFNSTGLPSSR